MSSQKPDRRRESTLSNTTGSAKKSEGKTVAKAKKQFSAKHETDDAHKAAQASFRDKQFIKKQRAYHRSEEAKGRTPREQLAILDQRLGVDVGARRERAKLILAIRAEFEPVNGRYTRSDEFGISADTYESDARIDSSYFIG